MMCLIIYYSKRQMYFLFTILDLCVRRSIRHYLRKDVLGGYIMEEMNHGYFEEALSNFTKDFASGGAVRHLVDHGYTVDRIMKEFNYPISRESIEKIVNQYLAQKK